MATIAVIGTFDSKGEEHKFIAEKIRQRGQQTLLIDVGTGAPASIVPDITREQVAAAAGLDLAPLLARKDRGECVTAMGNAAAILLARLAAENAIQGVISLGGGGGTALATTAMRALPLGLPKLMVSALAAGNTAAYLGTKDIVMMPSIADVAGLNRLSRTLFSQAAGAICGMVECEVNVGESRPLIVASMFGNTTACVTKAKEVLEQAGYEVLIFAATGAGGRIMESLIESGMVTAVLDLTTTELADEAVGGIMGAGPHRLEAAATANIPVVIAPGCIDMINFGEPDTIPHKFANRKFYRHNPQITLMRTSADECSKIGEIMAEKINLWTAPSALMFPRLGLSALGSPGQEFNDPIADDALFTALSSHVKIPVQSYDLEINDPQFAVACAEKLLELIALSKS
ncbi:Tm-1-like ATP-binding domain-containing protein [Luteolibacter pohnpeiensis]|uniref:Tm-1-like ATP-binding domain-containing protein n=1 Tax=Luteolibacter pohnpeiensis TaxID=454153 RepID=A0A934VRN8_9BACT|nr:Tm-1-like ATP-binding domain-containing protein [Luteolibacter pohnpeiensis]MBK1883416.1 Tm-1-like ATP-binding domain-containing protein [Luteolibacter pohnpeiensis]